MIRVNWEIWEKQEKLNTFIFLLKWSPVILLSGIVAALLRFLVIIVFNV
jgi:hypothetical protein